VAPAIIAAVITGCIAIVTMIVNGRRSRTDRQRAMFADAHGDVAAYSEYAYIVRRRRHDKAEAERTRISNGLSAVQQRLIRHQALLRVEAPRVARCYDALVAETRRVAGGAIKAGWDRPAITSDTGIHIPDVDLAPIRPFEDAYLQAVTDHLSPLTWWLRAAGRATVRTPGRAWRRLTATRTTTTGKTVASPRGAR
jgi:hypothetical protein